MCQVFWQNEYAVTYPMYFLYYIRAYEGIFLFTIPCKDGAARKAIVIVPRY